MTTWIVLVSISFAIIGYLFGNCLFGSIIGKIYKKNIRAEGSQNIGATNVSRSLGKGIGALVALLDTTKAYLSVIICWAIYSHSIKEWEGEQSLFCLIYLGGFFAVVGHCFPIIYIYKLFKTKFNFAQAKASSGGKGVSTAGGVILSVSPFIGLIGLCVWVIIIAITRYVSVGSMIAVFISAFLIFAPYINFLYLFDKSLGLEYDTTTKVSIFLFLICDALIVIARHMPNIVRLIHKEEKKIF